MFDIVLYNLKQLGCPPRTPSRQTLFNLAFDGNHQLEEHPEQGARVDVGIGAIVEMATSEEQEERESMTFQAEDPLLESAGRSQATSFFWLAFCTLHSS